MLVGQHSVAAVGVALVCVAAATGCVGRWRPMAVPLVCVGAIAAGCAWRLAALEHSPLRELAEERSVVVADAVVSSEPKRFSHFGSGSALVGLRVRRVTGEDAGTVGGSLPVLAVLRDAGRGLTVGDRVVASGRLRPSTESDVVAVLDVRQYAAGDSPWWWSAANRVRAGVRHGVRHASPDARALVPALVDGEDDALGERVTEEFRRAGLTHLLAVSGTNLTIVLTLALAVARTAGVGRRRLIGVGLLAVAGFVLLARPEPSVLRAAAMGSVGLVAIAVGGPGGLRALSSAVLALLFIDPWLARSPGFILSVCATAGILVGVSPLAARLARWMPRWCALAISVPVSAQAACLPAIVALSGQVSIVAVAANIVAAPLVAPATVAGLGAGLVDLVHPGLAVLPGTIAGWCANGIVAVARVAADLAGAAVPWRGPWWLLLISVPVAYLTLWRIANRPTIVVGLALGLSVGMARPPQVGWPPDGWLMVSCDVGQGDATVVNAGPSSAILVDAGPDPLTVDGCLRRLGVHHLPLAVITHAHADHVVGWPGAVRGRDTGAVLHGPSGGPGRPVVAGERFRVGAISVDVLWPPVGASRPDADDGTAMNDSSVVLRVHSHGMWMLLAGDVEPEAQSAIVASGVPLRSAVLKFPHHGSGAQSPEFLRAVGAGVATISVGADNDYGHPAPSALQMLRQVHTEWHRTDLEGDIAITLRGGRLGVVTRH
ncbi:MAG TPA: ComEC/Rec2 family competence protein [Aeromicrobium sp.]|nr:ComEC/Rec2 family competence protein [Aeromicrobium sp.]